MKLYGFIRLNATVDFQEMENSDLFRPARIQVGPDRNTNPHYFMSAKQSRFGVKVDRVLGEEALRAILEVDFHNTASSVGGLIRLRHAYLQYKGFTIGQAWSTFYDIQARPRIVDFEGANSATLNRSPLVRYDHQVGRETFSIALENPLEQVTVSGAVTVRKQLLPDLIGSYKRTWGTERNSFIKIAALVRQLKYEAPELADLDQMRIKNLYGWGVMSSGRIQLSGTDRLKYQVIAGNGIARYVRGVRGMGYDAICLPGCYALEGIEIYGGFVALEHNWSAKLSSTFLFGGIEVGQPQLFTGDDLDYCLYGSSNLFYQVNEAFLVGLEYLYGERMNLSGASGSANRLQMSAMMKF
jgi:hypothetical protein